jgi:hypothetical protein
MKNNGGASFFAVAIVLVVAGLFLRWDLVDWLIDAVGMLFIVAGIAAGAFAAVKAKSTIMGSLQRVSGTLEVLGVRASITMTTATAQSLGMGDGSTTTFSMLNSPVISGTEIVKVDGVAQPKGSAYSMNYDSGLVTFVSAPASSTATTADYTYYLVDRIRVTVSNVAAGSPVDLSGGKTVVT